MPLDPPAGWGLLPQQHLWMPNINILAKSLPRLKGKRVAGYAPALHGSTSDLCNLGNLWKLCKLILILCGLMRLHLQNGSKTTVLRVTLVYIAYAGGYPPPGDVVNTRRLKDQNHLPQTKLHLACQGSFWVVWCLQEGKQSKVTNAKNAKLQTTSLLGFLFFLSPGAPCCGVGRWKTVGWEQGWCTKIKIEKNEPLYSHK